MAKAIARHTSLLLGFRSGQPLAIGHLAFYHTHHVPSLLAPSVDFDIMPILFPFFPGLPFDLLAALLSPKSSWTIFHKLSYR